MSAGGLVRLALAPAVGFGTYWLVRLLDPTMGMAAGTAVMLALALLPGTRNGPRDAAFTQG